ncbi:MAG: zinc ribbon domain-containing protein [Methanobrevibacter sp.]|jgi:hypothetical protein|nr:zinc ribbon domain-containing protein [Candidatus Methanoflexus mossambicus]
MNNKLGEKFCTNCGAKNEASNKNCTNCGTPLKQIKTKDRKHCIYCGIELQNNEKDTCPNCENKAKTIENREKNKKLIKEKLKFLGKHKIKIFALILITIIPISTFYYLTYIYVANEEFYDASQEIFSPIVDIQRSITQQVIGNDMFSGATSFGYHEPDVELKNLDTSYENLKKEKKALKTIIQKLAKTAESDEEKEFVNLLKKQYSSLNSLIDNIKEVRDSNYAKKISYDKMHNFMMDTKEVYEFLKTHESFVSRYDLEELENQFGAVVTGTWPSSSGESVYAYLSIIL